MEAWLSKEAAARGGARAKRSETAALAAGLERHSSFSVHRRMAHGSPLTRPLRAEFEAVVLGLRRALLVDSPLLASPELLLRMLAHASVFDRRARELDVLELAGSATLIVRTEALTSLCSELAERPPLLVDISPLINEPRLLSPPSLPAAADAKAEPPVNPPRSRAPAVWSALSGATRGIEAAAREALKTKAWPRHIEAAFCAEHAAADCPEDASPLALSTLVGFLLAYPAVYCFADAPRGGSSSNCLSFCTLATFSASLQRHGQLSARPFLSFTVPACLLGEPQVRAALAEMQQRLQVARAAGPIACDGALQVRIVQGSVRFARVSL
jgi:hypothetical protein